MSFNVPTEAVSKASLDDPNWGTGAHEILISKDSLTELVEKGTA
ncbi:hypothetical protein [Alphaspiravirus yamagawaense]|uniref:Uncharacterized protein n=1 Tax=Alphaspiravirus yamagawaense TaxID=1157339 RepID=J7QDF0_9VIRU|nr:hypothetical protein [Aeropyrum coil-shaped virus]CCG27821.1 hypothetical protein [Aeropyrum coil-shaped virus]